MSDRPDNGPLRPEPEIIPPGQPDAGQRREGPPIWVASHRVYMAPPGPLGMLLGLAFLAALVALGFVLFLGFFLLWLPIVGVIAAVFIVSALFRGGFRARR
jgi:hypothetical protein